MFGTCEKLKPLWKIMSETITNVSGIRLDFSFLRINFAIDFVRINLHNHRKYEKLIVYFNTVVNYLIWKTRN